MIDLRQFEALTFDCYGTLIDWEAGIVNAMRPIVDNHGVAASDARILEVFSAHESVVQQPPYKTYTDVLAQVADAMAGELEFELQDDERERFARSVPDWPAFPDSKEGLRALARHYKLVILSNVDDDLFAKSAERLDVDFHEVITAQQVGSYKPNPRNFEVLLERLSTPKERILHVAQSLFHDIAPANDAGLATVWVNRRKGRGGWGATPPQEAKPDLEVPDLATLANLVRETFDAKG